ncbi:P-loop NTPase [Frisingicoccus sp.]|uniref:P-loop NTPase n=1 Tax=Frisingicoccus sp. TaxID=1918627 RepID=UPI002E98F90B|nr:Mrp/NBP35 family ATP-binding protein [Frisingicoccus sp.]
MSESCNGSCSSCGVDGCSSRTEESFLVAANAKSHIKHVIGIVSGKGGVGKSLVTSELAVMLQKQGYKVGIMDADITGPSIPKVFGVHGQAFGTEDGIIPFETKTGIKVMSVNLILDNEESPVIWRGPVIAGVVKQFWSEVVWGELDYLLVDMPPGTGDVPLTVFQSLPVDGIVVVTSPQELVGMIVKKAYNMAQMMNIPVIGLVQNMSYVLCPDCGKKIYIYGEGHGEETAKELNIPAYASLPIIPEIAALCDAGAIEDFENVYLTDFVKAITK